MSNYIDDIKLVSGLNAKINYKSLANKPVSDTSLSMSGEFADALIVGLKFNALKDDISKIETLLMNIHEKISSGYTMQEIDNMIVKYFEDKKVSEIEV